MHSSKRRGNVLSVEGNLDGGNVISAEVPLDTVLDYDAVLRNLTAGRFVAEHLGVFTHHARLSLFL